MACVEVDSVAVRVGLGIHHHVVEFTDPERAALASLKQFALEHEPRSNVDDDLVRSGKVDIEQGEPLLALQPRETRLDGQGFTKDACGFGEGHGQPLL